jgi:hypothetical protein
MSYFHLRPQLRAIRSGLQATSSTARACDWSRVRVALRAVPQAKRRVRVYAGAGFVPNSYKWTCKIQYVEATIKDGRVVSIATAWTGAQRPRGQGSLVVVQ